MRIIFPSDNPHEAQILDREGRNIIGDLRVAKLVITAEPGRTVQVEMECLLEAAEIEVMGDVTIIPVKNKHRDEEDGA